MDMIQASVLGIIQGLTEFLPVSSSGHLVLLQNLFGIEEPALLFDVSLHVGTLVAVCAVFYKEIKNIVLSILQLPAQYRKAGSWSKLYARNHEIRLAVLILAGSIPTAMLGLMFKEMIDTLFGSVRIVGIMLLVTGLLLLLTRWARQKERSLTQMTIKDALILGLVQGLAIIPGISRSGATISVALYLGIDRGLAARFSFLLSIPAIVGALLLSLDSTLGHNSIPGGIILLGSTTAAFVGYIALKILLRVVKSGQLSWFAPYCWLLGLLASVY